MRDTSIKLRFRNSARILIGVSVSAAALLLLSDLPWFTSRGHVYFSSLPLALAGMGYALLQVGVRPVRRVLFKRLLLAATFICWAVDQVLPVGPAATFVGDVVIAAFVLDLYWIVQEK